MILAFSQNLNNKQTLFVEKILNCLHYDLKLGAIINDYLLPEKLNYSSSYDLINAIRKQKSKKHTIRKDSGKRWKPGNDIHYSINVRKPNQFQFAPVVKCVSVQTIKISYNTTDTEAECASPAIYIDNNTIDFDTLTQLSKNDGFDSIADFLNYFNTDFTGKIIHWTNLKY